MSGSVTLEQVEQLAMQLPAMEQLKLVARISEQLSRSDMAELQVEAEPERWESEAMADALLRELDSIAESIDGEFDYNKWKVRIDG